MMKNLLYALSLVCLFTACGNEGENSINLKTSKVTLNYEDIHQIEALSDGVITYSSENEYHATVSAEGLVTAGRVGKTNILLSDGDSKQIFEVTVEPTSNLYPEPDVEFGVSRDDLIDEQGTPDFETETGIIYNNYSTNAPQVMYLFDENDRLESYGVTVNLLQGSNLVTFIEERYLPISASEEEYSVYCINKLINQNPTMGVALSLEDNYWMVIYLSLDSEKSASDNISSLRDRISKLIAERQ